MLPILTDLERQEKFTKREEEVICSFSSSNKILCPHRRPLIALKTVNNRVAKWPALFVAKKVAGFTSKKPDFFSSDKS